MYADSGLKTATPSSYLVVYSTNASACLVVTRHLFLLSSYLSSNVSNRAKQLGGILLFPSLRLETATARAFFITVFING
jgi:hypothetical protein